VLAEQAKLSFLSPKKRAEARVKHEQTKGEQREKLLKTAEKRRIFLHIKKEH
jgi:hypothetical protein